MGTCALKKLQRSAKDLQLFTPTNLKKKIFYELLNCKENKPFC